jgi:hypothetical protein
VRFRSVAPLLSLLAITISGCSYSIPRLSFAVEQRILRETTFDDMPEGEATIGDGVVRIVRTGNVGGRCSGALVGPRHVMTAAHCIAKRDTHREMVIGQVDAGDLHVELGGGYLPWGRAGVHHVRMCDGYVGDLEHDLAIVVLSRPVPAGVPVFDLAYDVPSDATVYELSGFGPTFKPKPMPDTRWSVISVERHVFRGPVTKVTDEAITVEVPVRRGDSGGPITDTASGRLVSIVSQGEMKTDPKTASDSESTTEVSPVVHGPRLYTCKKAIADALAR